MERSSSSGEVSLEMGVLQTGQVACFGLQVSTQCRRQAEHMVCPQGSMEEGFSSCWRQTGQDMTPKIGVSRGLSTESISISRNEWVCFRTGIWFSHRYLGFGESGVFGVEVC